MTSSTGAGSGGRDSRGRCSDGCGGLASPLARGVKVVYAASISAIAAASPGSLVTMELEKTPICTCVRFAEAGWREGGWGEGGYREDGSDTRMGWVGG